MRQTYDRVEASMKKASLLAVLLAFVAVFFTAIAILPERARATTLYVGGAGPGNYTTIQDAIDAASPGDTVYVYSGTYFENVIINKTITLKGEDRDTTMVEGNGTADTFQVSTDFVNISGFTIGGSGPSWEGSAIGLNSSQGCH
ncbi:MAG: nitrous oxide reductase family maturation protein NosD, partial [Thermoplasmata archaeon]